MNECAVLGFHISLCSKHLFYCFPHYVILAILQHMGFSVTKHSISISQKKPKH